VKIFCSIDSGGEDINHTNLQLYSLKQAARCWNELVLEIDGMDRTEIADITERLVFIVNCLGLSLTQLLGQNWPSDNKEKMDAPGDLLSNILNASHISKHEKARLNRGFREINRVYGAIRHFGRVKDNENYRLVEDLDLSMVDRFRKITIDLWDAVISVYRSYDINEIEEFDSIGNIVEFNELPGDVHCQ
jgi:hypothetical protein